MQPYEGMGDARHKIPPPSDPEEDVTDTFRRNAQKALDLNDERNRISKRRKGDPGYLISNRPELAEAVGTDKTMINKIIGPVKPTTKVKLVDRSAFVARIRKALDLEAVVQVFIPATRADAARALADLSDDEFAAYAQELARRTKRR